MTETLAKIYVKQGKFKNAINAYEILALKYPSCSKTVTPCLGFLSKNSADENIPKTTIEDYIITTPPFVEKGDAAFENETTIVLKSLLANGQASCCCMLLLQRCLTHD